MKLYRNVTALAEERLWVETTQVGEDGFSLSGAPLTILFNEPLSEATFNRFVELGLRRRTSRFRIGGYITRRGPTKVHLAAIDHHLWAAVPPRGNKQASTRSASQRNLRQHNPPSSDQRPTVFGPQHRSLARERRIQKHRGRVHESSVTTKTTLRSTDQVSQLDLLSDQVFQLNTFLWALESLSPSERSPLRPVLREAGYYLVAIGRKVLVPSSTRSQMRFND